MEQSTNSMKKLPGFSELFNGAKDMVMKRKELFFILAALPSVLQLIGVILLAVMPALAPLSVLLMIASIVVTFLVSIAMVKAVADQSLTDWKAVFSSSKALFWSYLWASILTGLAIMVGTVLFILPGIYLGIAFAFYYFTLILENKKGWESAQASKELVTNTKCSHCGRGYWWAVFGRVLLFGLVVAILAGIFTGIVAIANSEILNAIASALINIVVTPLGVAYSYLVYKSLKSMKGGEMMKQEA